MIKKILNVIKNPSKIFNRLRQYEEVRNSIIINRIAFFGYLTQILLNIPFNSHFMWMKKMAKNACGDERLGGWIDSACGPVIYAIIRHKKPSVVVETGVGPGSTSAFILKALADNKKGKLYSVDLPGEDAAVYPCLGKNFNVHVPDGFEVGWLVPWQLKHRWKLIIGDSKEQLPQLLKELGKVDIFLHDSLHTDEHILAELNMVWPHIGEEGVLLCDDVNEEWSTAFNAFCENKHIAHIVFRNRLGVAVVK